MKFGRWLYLGLVPMALLLAAFVFGLIWLVGQSFVGPRGFGFVHYASFFARTDYIEVLVRTVWVAALTTVICLAIGYPAAYFIARTTRHRNYLLMLVILPWLVSVVVRTYGWVVILGNKGLVNSLLAWTRLADRPIPMMFNVTGIVIGLVHVFCPFMIIAILSSFMQMERSLEEAAMSLGARPWRTFRKVLLPLTLPGVISGTILVYLMSMGAIVTPLLLGGLRDRMLGTQIYQELFQLFNTGKASAMAVILTVAALVVILPLQWLEHRVSRHTRSVLGD